MAAAGSANDGAAEAGRPSPEGRPGLAQAGSLASERPRHCHQRRKGGEGRTSLPPAAVSKSLGSYSASTFTLASQTWNENEKYIFTGKLTKKTHKK